MRAPFGLTVVFLNVLLDQLGLPVPAVPTLVVAGAMASDGRLPALQLYLLAFAACVIADWAWYGAGRIYGGRVMKLLCRVSLSPDSCVSEAQTAFERWGAKALLVAKFVPGLSVIAPPLAGATRMRLGRFTALSALGSLLWVGAALVAGILLRSQIKRLLPWAAHIGSTAALVVVVLLAAYIAFKWRERRRFYAALDMARISVAELRAHMDAGAAPVVIDVRSLTAQTLELRRIPGALHLPVQDFHHHVAELPRDRDIILYCNCPNEASAAQAARVLMRNGFERVRPLAGGLDAWIAAGYAVETISVASAGAALLPPPATAAAQPTAQR